MEGIVNAGPWCLQRDHYNFCMAAFVFVFPSVVVVISTGWTTAAPAFPGSLISDQQLINYKHFPATAELPPQLKKEGKVYLNC